MNIPPPHWIEVAVQTPAHSGVGELLSYRSPRALAPGQLVRVPLGKREVLGVVWRESTQAPALAEGAVREVAGVLDGLTPLSAHWRQLMAFEIGRAHV